MLLHTHSPSSNGEKKVNSASKSWMVLGSFFLSSRLLPKYILRKGANWDELRPGVTGETRGRVPAPRDWGGGGAFESERPRSMRSGKGEKKRKKARRPAFCNKSRTRPAVIIFLFSLVLRPEKVKLAIFPVFFGFGLFVFERHRRLEFSFFFHLSLLHWCFPAACRMCNFGWKMTPPAYAKNGREM